MAETTSTATTPIGWIAWILSGGLNGMTASVLFVRRLASWFKANYWHAFVCGLAAAWLMMVSHDLFSHPLTWAAWSAQPAQKMIGLPVTMPAVSDATVAPVKSAKKAKKTAKRPHDALADFKPF